MMSALPQPTTSPALATFLAAIGQAPATGGEGGSFSQLLAATPQPMLGDGPIPVITKLELPQGGEGITLPPAEAIDVEAAAKPAVAKDAVPADTAAATAASLLIAIAGAGAVPGTKPASTQPAGTTPETDAEASAEPAAAITLASAEPAVPVAAWSPIVAASPTAGKSAKPTGTAAASSDDMTSSIPVAAKQASAPLATLAALPTEPQAAKAAPAEASMTVLFTQPGTQGPAALGEAVQPAIVTERTLDIGSDDAWIDQQAHDIAAAKSTTGDVSFRLMPRHLGRLDVAMQMGDEGVSLKLDTQHEATAVIVTAAQTRLVEDLRQQGVRVAGAVVNCTPGETGRQSQQGQGRGATQDAVHLIETATEHTESRDEDRAADRRGRFA